MASWILRSSHCCDTHYYSLVFPFLGHGWDDPQASIMLPLKSPHPNDAIDEKRRQTGLQWPWFEDARVRNPHLGTLGYLPIEIRHLIYQHITATYEKEWHWVTHRSGWFIGELTTPVDWINTKTWEPRESCDGVPALRRASEAIRVEYDQKLLTESIITLDGSDKTVLFLSKVISPLQRTWIRRVSFTIEADHRRKTWGWFFRKYAPPNLQEVTIDLDHDHGRKSYLGYLRRLPPVCNNRACWSLSWRETRLFKPYNQEESSNCKHQHSLYVRGKAFEKQMRIFEVVVKVLKANQPQARVQLGWSSCIHCQGFCDAILQNARTEEVAWLVPLLDISLDAPTFQHAVTSGCRERDKATHVVDQQHQTTHNRPAA